VGSGYISAIQSKADSLVQEFTQLEKELIQTQNESGQDPINCPPQIDNQFAYLFTVVNNQDARPAKGSYQRFQNLENKIDPCYQQFKKRLKNLMFC
jgi:hypothetical protein